MPSRPSPGATAAARSTLSSVYQSTSANEDSLVRVARRMMGPLSAPLLPQMGITPETTEPVALLDSACGAGVITQEVHATLPRDVLEKSSFLCADVTPGLVEVVQKRALDEGWHNVEAKVLDAMDTGLPADSFSHVALALALHLIPDPDAVVKDCMRILKPGGLFGATTFQRDTGAMFWYPDMRSAFASFPFDASLPEHGPMQIHDSGRWTDAGWVEGHLAELGLQDVQVKTHQGQFRVEGAADFVETFGSMLQWMMKAHWSEETRAAHPEKEVRELVRRHLEGKHHGEGWDLSWRVICMTGRVG